MGLQEIRFQPAVKGILGPQAPFKPHKPAFAGHAINLAHATGTLNRPLAPHGQGNFVNYLA